MPRGVDWQTFPARGRHLAEPPSFSQQAPQEKGLAEGLLFAQKRGAQSSSPSFPHALAGTQAAFFMLILGKEAGRCAWRLTHHLLRVPAGRV